MHSQPAGINSLISVRAGLAGQSKHIAKPPEVAIGHCSALQETSPRSQERRRQSAQPSIVSTSREAGEEFGGSAWLQGATRHARSLGRAADAGYRDCSCRGVQREAGCHACKSTLVSLPRELMPNPSLKASPNSVAHWLSSAGPAAHFALALQRATLPGPP